MKRCPSCCEYKTHAEFNSRVRFGHEEYSSYCKSCQSAYCKEHYKQYKLLHNRRRQSNNKRYTARNRAFIVEYLREHPCVDCGETDPIVLEFDHVRGEKIQDLSVMIAVGRRVSRIQEEILKCDVRCANCHRRKTATEFNWYRVGA